MNVFVPYSIPLDCAKAMWGDSRRYNKQIIECRQIIAAIEGTSKSWSNHPVCLMYKEHKSWLLYYMKCFECYRNYKKAKINSMESLLWIESAKRNNAIANYLQPPFIDEPMQIQHRRRLYTKSPNLYPQFAGYGTSEENWYVVDGKFLKYVNGKRIK